MNGRPVISPITSYGVEATACREAIHKGARPPKGSPLVAIGNLNGPRELSDPQRATAVLPGVLFRSISSGLGLWGSALDSTWPARSSALALSPPLFAALPT